MHAVGICRERKQMGGRELEYVQLNLAIPERPWPEVQPFAILAPNMSANPPKKAASVGVVRLPLAVDEFKAYVTAVTDS